MPHLIDISEKVTLTPAQMQLWEETLTAFSWHAPAFTHILYDMLNPERGRIVATFLGTKRVPEWFIAGTNGKRLFIVPERYFAVDLMRRVFVLAHEVAHPMLGHIVASHYYRQRGEIELGFKKMKYYDILAGWAQDYVINDMLIESRIGTFLETGLWDKNLGTFKDSWIDVYEKLYAECDAEDPEENTSDGSGGPVKRKGKSGFDFHLGHGQGEPDPTDASKNLRGDEHISQDQLEAELQRARQSAAAAIELARARGKLPLALEQFAEKILEPTIEWNDHLKAQFARRVGSGTYDFRRPDRRLIVRDIIAPGRSGFRCDTIVLGADSSGSIYVVPKLIDRWFGETSGIMEDCKPKEIHVVWCDAKVQRVDIVTDPQDLVGMFYRGAKGGGGTSFVPVFEYAASLDRDIDCMAYLTDGDGDFPDEAPPYPVIWGSIKQPPDHYPFGDVVMIPVPAGLV